MCSSAISVPNSGLADANEIVPSIGSSTQTNSASGALFAVLLAEDAVLREALRDHLAHQCLGVAVGAVVTDRLVWFLSSMPRVVGVAPK